MVPLSNKKTCMMYKNYTYSRNGRYTNHRYCSQKRSYDCRARLYLDNDGNILKMVGKHNHPPPQFRVQNDGTFVKIKD